MEQLVILCPQAAHTGQCMLWLRDHGTARSLAGSMVLPYSVHLICKRPCRPTRSFISVVVLKLVKPLTEFISTTEPSFQLPNVPLFLTDSFVRKETQLWAGGKIIFSFIYLLISCTYVFYFMCIHVCPAWISVHHVCAWGPWRGNETRISGD